MLFYFFCHKNVTKLSNKWFYNIIDIKIWRATCSYCFVQLQAEVVEIAT